MLLPFEELDREIDPCVTWYPPPEAWRHTRSWVLFIEHVNGRRHAKTARQLAVIVFGSTDARHVNAIKSMIRELRRLDAPIAGLWPTGYWITDNPEDLRVTIAYIERCCSRFNRGCKKTTSGLERAEAVLRRHRAA